jgi:branched-chain amino acid transport system ATP-binding protein
MRVSEQRLLDVRGLEVAYGPVTAVRGVSLHVDEGEVVALLGANGGGKSSTLRGISGVVRPQRGRVRFAGRRIDAASPQRIVHSGFAHVPEGRRVFAGLTVEENLTLGAWASSARRSRLQSQRELVYELFPRLAERRKQAAGSMSGGEQQMVAIGRALMSCPRLLAVDEMSLGLAPQFIDELLDGLLRLNRDGLALLLVEQFVHRALAVAGRVYVLEKGRVAYTGTAQEAARSDAIEAAYMAEGVA